MKKFSDYYNEAAGWVKTDEEVFNEDLTMWQTALASAGGVAGLWVGWHLLQNVLFAGGIAAIELAETASDAIDSYKKKQKNQKAEQQFKEWLSKNPKAKNLLDSINANISEIISLSKNKSKKSKDLNKQLSEQTLQLKREFKAMATELDDDVRELLNKMIPGFKSIVIK